MKVICIVDDDDDDRQLLKEAIRETALDFQVIEFDDGYKLIQFIESQKQLADIALVTIDMNMPRINGLETIEVIRSHANSYELPAIMLSTASDNSLIESAYLAGFNHFANKPSTYKELKTLIQFLIIRFSSTR